MRHVPSAAWGVLRQAVVGGKRTGNGKEDPNPVRGRRGVRRLSHLRWVLARPRAADHAAAGGGRSRASVEGFWGRSGRGAAGQAGDEPENRKQRKRVREER